MDNCDIGLIGLAVMGQNLVLNMESKGFSVAVHNRTTETTERFLAGNAAGKRIVGTRTVEEFVRALARPRRIMIMVKAGAPVDEIIAQVAPLLEKGDLLVDGGNSQFTDTERRAREMETRGLLYLGAGVSGGEEGALRGPAIMPGGSREAWALVEPIFTRIAAQVDGEPCCRYVGPGGAGHYVKMVHNGIEYGDMQLICESYALMKGLLGLDADALAEVFARWNRGALDSYLIEITAEIFRRRDPETGDPLVEKILDRAGQKGTGRWTLLSAIDLGVAAPTIHAAVEARTISSQKEARTRAARLLPAPAPAPVPQGAEAAEIIEAIHDALYASKIVSYAQGMALLGAGSQKWGWDLDFGGIASIWRGGCIIRAQFLHRIREAYARDPALESLLLDPHFGSALERAQPGWRRVVRLAAGAGVAAPAFMASLSYFDSMRTERSPANLLQAQRDFFGAHTYERVDRPGTFHTEWSA